MNKKILNKSIEELKKDIPNIMYVLGMLETLAEMEGEPFVPASFAPTFLGGNGFGFPTAGSPSNMVPFDSMSPEEQAMHSAMAMIPPVPPAAAEQMRNINL